MATTPLDVIDEAIAALRPGIMCYLDHIVDAQLKIESLQDEINELFAYIEVTEGHMAAEDTERTILQDLRDRIVAATEADEEPYW